METKVFPGMVVQMIGVGEQTGALDQMLNKIADFYEEEVDAAVSSMTALLEPLMLAKHSQGGFLQAVGKPQDLIRNDNLLERQFFSLRKLDVVPCLQLWKPLNQVLPAATIEDITKATNKIRVQPFFLRDFFVLEP